ncbi:unnamed protein product [Brassicogethes aeneus]|uniref:Uncharacterized protein n=1 Tax=Brassicogethes aeneus TaxID=1431903 RepID=A0A9P0BI95_BRAAE|nr:unnamed protein product [Brassicogethes aeneus]
MCRTSQMARILKGPKGKHTNVDYGNLGKYMHDAAQKYANNIFQIDADLDIKETYAQAHLRARRLALSLKGHGLQKDDIITICSRNNLNNVIPLIAGLFLGAKIASIDPTLSLIDCKHCINLVKPKFIFVENTSVELIESSLDCIGCAPIIVVIGKFDRHLSFDDLTKEHKDEATVKPVVFSSKETAFIFFSSGTTGLPKGICCSHDAIFKTAINILDSDFLRSDVNFHLTTLYWISAIICLMRTYIKGGQRVFSSNPTPVGVLKLFDKYKVTSTLFPPLFSYGLLEVPNLEKYNLESLYSVTFGGTPMTTEQITRMRDTFKHVKFQVAYGMTETSGCITHFDFTRDKDIYLKKEMSSGKAAVDVEIKIVDIETRKLLPPNQNGEILVKPASIPNGYHKNSEMSHNFDKEGYLKTGDVGYYDEDECVYIVDRIKEMFKYQSWHIVPNSIEQVLMEHPAIEEAVVFGIPHGADGDVPTACIILKNNQVVSVEELHKFVNERVADRQRLRGGIKFVDSISKTPSGKFQRRRIREMYKKL